MLLPSADPETLKVYVPAIATIVATAITTVGLVFIALIPYFRVKRRDRRDRAKYRTVLDEVHDHVANTHSTNLRDDIDELLREGRRTNAMVAEIASRQSGILRTAARLDRRVSGIDKRVGGIDRRLASLEPATTTSETTEAS